ncbi:MAG: hypothetical protein GY789_16545 [Hyphomicrobiales bacterium]|nr:hypothetical protein [Hyphomicrobiales bacterium]
MNHFGVAAEALCDNTIPAAHDAHKSAAIGGAITDPTALFVATDEHRYLFRHRTFGDNVAGLHVQTIRTLQAGKSSLSATSHDLKKRSFDI